MTDGRSRTSQPSDSFTPAQLTAVMGLAVSRKDFAIEEDHGRPITTGLNWRRRRLRFTIQDTGSPEGLCLNELTIDPTSGLSLRPLLTTDYPHLCDFPDIEHSFWSTTWATGAVRHDHGMRSPRLFLRMRRLSDQDAATQAELWERVRTESLRPHNGETLRGLVHPLSELDARFVEGHNPSAPGGIVRWFEAMPPSRLVQSSGNILAAIAAGFFLNFPEEYDDGVSALHQPIGAIGDEGDVVVPAWSARPTMVVERDGTARLELIGPDRMQLVVKPGSISLALVRAAADFGKREASVWLAWDPVPPPPEEDMAEIVFSGAVPISWGPAQPRTKVPVGGALLRLKGKAAQVVRSRNSEAFEVSLKWDPALRRSSLVLAAGPMLVRDGAALDAASMFDPANAGDLGRRGCPPLRFDYRADRARAPRTALGFTKSGEVKLIVVDGRRGGEHSPGLTLDGLAHLCLLLGCHQAINLDGGGSAAMVLEGLERRESLNDHLPIGLANMPSDHGGRERILPVMLGVVSE